MINDLEKTFLNIFEIKDYQLINDHILLELENIFAHSEQDDTGFFNGFKVEKRYNYWIYQLTYYKGGYYKCGLGKTRKEALLNQFITILNDKNVEEKEKQVIKDKVKKLILDKKNRKEQQCSEKHTH